MSEIAETPPTIEAESSREILRILRRQIEAAAIAGQLPTWDLAPPAGGFLRRVQSQ